MASPRSMPADVGRLAAFLTPHRSPPAPGALWGHAPPTWRPGGACRRPNHARFGPWLGQRPWSVLGLCGHIRPTRATEADVGCPHAPRGPSGSLEWRGACRCAPGSAKKLIPPNTPGIGWANQKTARQNLTVWVLLCVCCPAFAPAMYDDSTAAKLPCGLHWTVDTCAGRMDRQCTPT